MLQLIKREPTAIGGALIPPATHLGLFADENENWYAVDSSGQPKLLGNGIKSIEKTGTVGNLDTYTVTLTDDSTSEFTVTNGSVTSVNGETGDVTLVIPEVDPLNLSERTTAPEPVEGVVRLFGRKVAGRIMTAAIGPSGLDTRLQPHLGANRVNMWQPNGANGILVTTFGGLWTSSALTAAPMLDTEIGRVRKVRNATAATAAAVAFLRSDLAYSLKTGFHSISHFTPFESGVVASRRFISGFSAVNLTNIALSGYAAMGVQADATQTTLRIRGFDGVETDLGASFPADDPNVWYRFEMFCPPNGSTVSWQITNMFTGNTTSGELTGAQLPADTLFMASRTEIVTVTGAQGIWMGPHMVETDL